MLKCSFHPRVRVYDLITLTKSFTYHIVYCLDCVQQLHVFFLFLPKVQSSTFAPLYFTAHTCRHFNGQVLERNCSAKLIRSFCVSADRAMGTAWRMLAHAGCYVLAPCLCRCTVSAPMGRVSSEAPPLGTEKKIGATSPNELLKIFTRLVYFLIFGANEIPRLWQCR